MAVLIQNLNRALFCLILTPGNKISFLGSYQKALTRCCNDPLRPPRFSGVGKRLSCLVLVRSNTLKVISKETIRNKGQKNKWQWVFLKSDCHLKHPKRSHARCNEEGNEHRLNDRIFWSPRTYDYPKRQASHKEAQKNPTEHFHGLFACL